MQAVALCSDVPALALTEANLAALLHPRIDAESCRAEVADALASLVATTGSARATTATTSSHPSRRTGRRHAKARNPGRRRYPDPQGDHPPSAHRPKCHEGPLLQGRTVGRRREARRRRRRAHIEEADAARRDQLRSASREELAGEPRHWLYSLSDETYRCDRGVVPQRRDDQIQGYAVEDNCGSRAARRRAPASGQNRATAHRRPDPRHDRLARSPSVAPLTMRRPERSLRRPRS